MFTIANVSFTMRLRSVYNSFAIRERFVYECIGFVYEPYTSA